MPSGYKPLHTRSDEDVIRIVGEDFDASEYDRREKNQRNFQAYRMFHCRDLLKTPDVTRNMAGEVVLGGMMPAFDLGPIEANRTYLPWIRGIVLTSVARLAHGLWPDFNDFFRVDPDDPDDEKAAKGAFALAKYFIRSSRYKQESLLALLQCHMFDFSLLYTGWRTDYGIVPVPIESDIQVKNYETGEWHDTGRIDERRREFEYQETQTSGWDVAAMNTLNARVDPLASHEGFGEFVGFTCLFPKRRAWQLVEAGEWDEAAVAEIDKDESPNEGGQPDDTVDFTKRLKEDEHEQGYDFSGYIEKRYMRADFYWSNDSKAVILNKRTVPRKEQSWRIPFHKQVFIQNAGIFSGTSLVEPLMSAQLDINQCLRLLRTQQDRAVNPDSVVDPSFFRSPFEAEVQPWNTGATIMLTRADGNRDTRFAKQFIQYPTGTATDMWNSITIQTQFGERASGIGQNDQGDIAQGGASATEIARVAAGVDIRGAFVEVYIEESIVIMPVDDLLKMITVNVTQPMRIRISGEEGKDWQTVDPKDLAFKKSPDVVALGMSSMSSRAVGAQAVRDVTLAFLANPLTAQWMKVVPSMQQVCRLMDIDPDTMIADQDPTKQSSIPPRFIPKLLATGEDIPINPWDDHEAVIIEIRKFFESPDFQKVPEENRELMLRHVQARKQLLDQAAMGGGTGAPSLPSEFGGGGGAGGPQMVPGAPQQQQEPLRRPGGRPQQVAQPMQPSGAVAGGG